MRDQPDHPLDRSTYWIEYVIRHKGAPQLRTASRKLSLSQRGLLDVMFISVTIFIIIALLFIYSIIRLVSSARPKFSIHLQKKNN